MRKRKKKFGYFKFGEVPVPTQNYDYGSYCLLSAHHFSQGILNGQGKKG